MKYIDADKLKAEIEHRINLISHRDTHSEVMKRVEGVLKGYNSILDFINSLQQEQLSSNLDEVAEEYANKEHPDEPSVGQWGTGDYEPPIDREYPREIAKDAFKKGAEWQKEQDELTWQDIAEIWHIVENLYDYGDYTGNAAYLFYNEALEKFKEYKKAKK